MGELFTMIIADFKIAEWKIVRKELKTVFKNLKNALEKNGYNGKISHIEQMLFSKNFRNIEIQLLNDMKEKLLSGEKVAKL